MGLVKARTSIPFSGIREIGTNVPCLKHFFRCLETSGTQISDSKGGVVIDMADAQPTAGAMAFDSSTKTVYPSTHAGQFTNHAGTWASVPAGYSVLNFAVGDVQEQYNTRFPVGGGSGHGFSINTVGTHMIVDGASAAINYNTDIAITSLSRTGTTVTATKVAHGLLAGDIVQFWGQTPSDMSGSFVIGVPTADTITYTSAGTQGAASVPGKMTTNATLNGDQIYIYQTYDPNTGIANMKSYLADCTTVRVDMTSTTTVGTIAPDNSSRPTGCKMYGWAVFYFSGGLPADLKVALDWMSGEWRRGNRYIWPGWIALT